MLEVWRNCSPAGTDLQISIGFRSKRMFRIRAELEFLESDIYIEGVLVAASIIESIKKESSDKDDCLQIDFSPFLVILLF